MMKLLCMILMFLLHSSRGDPSHQPSSVSMELSEKDQEEIRACLNEVSLISTLELGTSMKHLSRSSCPLCSLEITLYSNIVGLFYNESSMDYVREWVFKSFLENLGYSFRHCIEQSKDRTLVAIKLGLSEYARKDRCESPHPSSSCQKRCQVIENLINNIKKEKIDKCTEKAKIVLSWPNRFVMFLNPYFSTSAELYEKLYKRIKEAKE